MRWDAMKRYIRIANQHFTIPGPRGAHTVLVQEPACRSLAQVAGFRQQPQKHDNWEDYTKNAITVLLHTLDSLHNKAKIVYGGENCCCLKSCGLLIRYWVIIRYRH
jgi:hypothetical protein